MKQPVFSWGAAVEHDEKSLRLAIWLLLYTQGGRWSRSDIAARTALPTNDPLLHEMRRKNMITSWGEGRGRRFGVTGGCIIPAGLRLADLHVDHAATSLAKPNAEAVT